MQIRETLLELYQWLISLPPDFMFLMLLPFVVALAGLARDSGSPPLDEAQRQRPRRRSWRAKAGISA